MRKSLSILAMALFFPVALILFQGVAAADGVSMALVSIPTSGVLGNVYTSPYSIEVGVGNTIEALSCDDYLTDIGVPTYWTATENTLGALLNITAETSVPIGATLPTKYPLAGDDEVYLTPDGGSTQATLGPLDAFQQYYMVAFLADTMLHTASGSLAQEELSYAIWQIFDQSAYLGYNGGELSTQQQSDVNADITSALNYITNTPLTPSSPLYDMEIYTPCGPAGGVCTPGSGPNGTDQQDWSQEFVGWANGTPVDAVPEGSSFATLAFDLSAVLAGIFLLRKRILA